MGVEEEETLPLRNTQPVTLLSCAVGVYFFKATLLLQSLVSRSSEKAWRICPG